MPWAKYDWANPRVPDDKIIAAIFLIYFPAMSSPRTLQRAATSCLPTGDDDYIVNGKDGPTSRRDC